MRAKARLYWAIMSLLMSVAILLIGQWITTRPRPNSPTSALPSAVQSPELPDFSNCVAVLATERDFVALELADGTSIVLRVGDRFADGSQVVSIDELRMVIQSPHGTRAIEFAPPMMPAPDPLPPEDAAWRHTVG